MLTPKQIKIFEAFLLKPYKEFTYKEIKEYAREKSNSVIQKAILKFIAEELVKKRKIGNMIVYALNLKNNVTFSYFDILIRERLSDVVRISIKRIKEEMVDNEFISIVVFGSYAEGKQTRKSDLDIAVFVNTERDKRKCEMSIKSAELKSILPIDAHVITKKEMLQMLKSRYENLGKQIAYKHLAVYNQAIFYSILQDGIDNGFKIVY